MVQNDDKFQFHIRQNICKTVMLMVLVVHLNANDDAEINTEMSGKNPLIHAHSGVARTFFTGYLVG